MNKTIIIAEVGSNHEGQWGIAEHYIETAKQVGADVVKFQLHGNFDPEWIPKITEKCFEEQIFHMYSVFNVPSLDLVSAETWALKIASPEVTNIDLIRAAAKTTMPLVISDGGGSFEQAQAVYNMASEFSKNVTLLHCVSDYPAKAEDYDLSILARYKAFGAMAGISDHTTSPFYLPSVAVAAGAQVIEKHITLNKRLKTPDAPFSLEPGEFQKMVEIVRTTEQVMSGPKKTLPEKRTILWPN